MLEDVEEVELGGLGVLLRAPESEFHRNTYLCLDELAASSAERATETFESLKERRLLNPDRAVGVVPDGDAQLLAAAREITRGIGVAVMPLGAFLDAHLR